MKVSFYFFMSVLFLSITTFSVQASEHSTANEALLKGAQEGELEVVKKALEDGADINLKDTKGNSVLILSIIFDKHYIATYLIEKKVRLDITDKGGDTALTKAIQTLKSLTEKKFGIEPEEKKVKSHIKIIKLLIRERADVSLINKNRKSPQKNMNRNSISKKEIRQ